MMLDLYVAGLLKPAGYEDRKILESFFEKHALDPMPLLICKVESRFVELHTRHTASLYKVKAWLKKVSQQIGRRAALDILERHPECLQPTAQAWLNKQSTTNKQLALA